MTNDGATDGAVTDDVPRLIEVDGFYVAGLAVRTKNEREMDPSTSRIGPLWQRFFQDEFAGQLEGCKNPSEVLGVYSDYESDADGEYTLIVGCEVAEDFDGPLETVGVEVPAGRYLVFTGEGEMPAVVVQTWQRIWGYFAESSEHRRAFDVDFERHDSNRAGRVEILISIE